MQVRAITTFHGPDNLTIHTGEVRESSDPIVRARPDLFEPADVVESATAAPGERRSVRRSTKVKADESAAEGDEQA